jgi:hypothetical protein
MDAMAQLFTWDFERGNEKPWLSTVTLGPPSPSVSKACKGAIELLLKRLSLYLGRSDAPDSCRRASDADCAGLWRRSSRRRPRLGGRGRGPIGSSPQANPSPRVRKASCSRLKPEVCVSPRRIPAARTRGRRSHSRRNSLAP